VKPTRPRLRALIQCRCAALLTTGHLVFGRALMFVTRRAFGLSCSHCRNVCYLDRCCGKAFLGLEWLLRRDARSAAAEDFQSSRGRVPEWSGSRLQSGLHWFDSNRGLCVAEQSEQCGSVLEGVLTASHRLARGVWHGASPRRGVVHVCPVRGRPCVLRCTAPDAAGPALRADDATFETRFSTRGPGCRPPAPPARTPAPPRSVRLR
jgi:hypothetical protein